MTLRSGQLASAERHWRFTWLISKSGITTNPARSCTWWDLTEKEKAEFDYIEEANQDDAEFVRYRGVLYDLHDMERGWGGCAMPEPFKGWDNYRSDSYFSGILIRWVDQGERVICATYTCEPNQFTCRGYNK